MSPLRSQQSRLPRGVVPPGQLADARLQCHHAAQILVSLGISLLPHREDDSHTNLGWDPELRALTTHPVPGTAPFRGGLAIAELELLVAGEGISNRIPLAGRTIADAWQWLLAEVKKAGGDVKRMTDARHYTIPSHPVAAGAPFQRQPAAAFAELAAFYGFADSVLKGLVARNPGAAAVRCWPHHFDIATLITLPPSGPDARTVGAGLSPGDDSYAEPYFYVTPYPYPPVDRLARLPSGHWHTAGWTGAVLKSTDLLSRTDDPEQHTALFFDSALESCRQALVEV
ncbi:MAG: hypothetical protein ABI836_01345 [Gemmatimonadota bacterium]